MKTDLSNVKTYLYINRNCICNHTVLLHGQAHDPKSYNNTKTQLTASTEGVWIWMMHLTSGRAACIAACNMKPATLIPKFVVPCSTTLPCISIFTRLDAVISWYSIPNGFTRKCCSSWFNLACNTTRNLTIPSYFQKPYVWWWWW